MYHEVSIEALSPAQHSRLRNGHGVRVKLGHGHKLKVSVEQHKKLHKAHMKGMGVVLRLDPFQQAHEKDKRGMGKHHKMGRGTPIMEQGFTGNEVAHFLGAHESSEPFMNKKVTGNQIKEAGARAKHFFGLGVRRGRPKKGGAIGDDIKHFFTHTIPSGLIHQGIPATASFLGGLGTAELGGVGSIPAGIAGKALADRVGKQTGLGVKRRGRPRGSGVKHTRKGKGIFGSKFDKAVEKLVGKENAKAGYDLIKKHGKKLFERGLGKAEKLAVEHGLPADASHLASNLIGSYVAHPSSYQNAKNLVGAIEHGALTGEGVKRHRRPRGAGVRQKKGEGVKHRKRSVSRGRALMPAGY
jgi:hypothetical protein